MAISQNDIADVLIVGSGPAGGAFAWHLSKVPGISIVCLEQGDWASKPATGVSEAASQTERLATRTSTPPGPGIKTFANGYPYDHSESYWTPTLFNAVGGGGGMPGSGGWTWCRMLPSDFVTRSLDGVGEDWPIRYWDLAPYYDLLDNYLGVSGIPGDPAYPPRSVKMHPPFRMNNSSEILSRGYRKLGWHYWPTEMLVITQPHGGRTPCPLDADYTQGCPRDAWATPDQVFWPQAIQNGVVLKTRARVREILVDKRGVAEGALYYDAEGRLQRQKARIVVMACNSFGTARLLLNSKSRHFPQGLANGSGQVGRNLMAHPTGSVTAFHPDADPRQRHSCGLRSLQFAESDLSRGFRRGVRMFSTGYMGPITLALGEPDTTGRLIPVTYRTDLSGGGGLQWGALHHAAFQERAHTISLSVEAEQLPEDSDNRVELHPTLTDDMGIPAIKLFYKDSENTLKVFAWALERAKEVVMAAGATKIISAEKRGAVQHIMGTARMGTDPQKSVVDKWCRTHDVKNLFVIDGSVFTTSGTQCPTSTIYSIAVRAADYFKTNTRALLD